MLDCRRLLGGPAPTILALLATVALAACTAADGDTVGDVDLEADVEAVKYTSGPNGWRCVQSPYNCDPRKNGGNRVVSGEGSSGLEWTIEPGLPVRDGTGAVMYAQSTSLKHLWINWGQRDTFDGQPHVLAMFTSNTPPPLPLGVSGSPGWYPLAAFEDAARLKSKLGSKEPADPKGNVLGCYRIKESAESAAATYGDEKVIRDYNPKEWDDSQDKHGNGKDYLPRVRSNGEPYTMLVYNVPGSGLGGQATNVFPARTKFRRVAVPTANGASSIGTQLWKKREPTDATYSAKGHKMKFVYGYVRTSDGAKHFGWIAFDALAPGCG